MMGIPERVICAVLCVLLVFVTVVPACSAVEYSAGSASAAVLMEADSGRVLFEKNGDAKMRIASTTKILTALVVLERCGLSETVAVRREWLGAEGSSIYLKEGETLTVEELLYGMLLESGNDAAEVLAYHVAGSISKFSRLMCRKASALGAENSSFKNPSGLDEDGHYSTARDLALITKAAMENEDFARIVGTKSISVAGRNFENHNKLLWQLEGACGVKTGYTSLSGRSLVSCCRRNGVNLICVTINAPNDWQDHAGLYESGFAACIRAKIAAAGDEFISLPLIGGHAGDVKLTVAEDVCVTVTENDTLNVEPLLPEFVYAGVHAGDVVGRLIVTVNGSELCNVPVVCLEDAPANPAAKEGLLRRMRRSLSSVLDNQSHGYILTPGG